MRHFLRSTIAQWTWGHTAVVVVLAASALRLVGPTREVDLYWHILMGYDILQNSRLSGSPDLTFGPSVDWVTTQAGSEVLAYLWYSLFGLKSFALVRVVGGTLMVGASIIAAYCLTPRSTSRSLRLWVAAATGLLVSQIPSAQERPQTLTFILLPVVAIWVFRVVYTGKPPRWWLVPVLVIPWVWIHGGALLVAPALLAAWLLHVLAVRFGLLPGSDIAPWRGPAVALLAFAATLANPIGWGVYVQASRIAESASFGIIEWERPFPDYPLTYLTMPVVVLLWGLMAFVLYPRSFSWRVLLVDALVLIPFLVYSETANRAVPVALLLTAPLVARRTSQAVRLLWKSPVPTVPMYAAFPSAVTVAVVSVVVASVTLPSVGVVGTNTPVRILNGLAASPGGRDVVTFYGLSGRTQFFTGSNVRTALDGRSDRYSRAQLDSYVELERGQGDWEVTLDGSYSSATDYVDVAHSGLVDRLVGERGWSVHCEETDASGMDWVWLTAPGVVSAPCPVSPEPLVPRIDR